MENYKNVDDKKRIAVFDIEDELDFDFSHGQVMVNTLEEFEELLMKPYRDPSRKIYYRGERINDIKRPLLPTLFRDKKTLMKEGTHYTKVDIDVLLDMYQKRGKFFQLFNTVFGSAGRYHMYDLCSFSQHYLNLSPLIDFTKSLYVALSFGLKEKTEFVDDGVIYTVEINDEENYTRDRVVAECWLNEYSVDLYDFTNAPNTPEVKEQKLKATKMSSPSAKLIDIATNDLMKYQQGVFLLLSDFSLVGKVYLTKNIRNSVIITKYLINKDICADLVRMVADRAPWYRFSQLLDISSGVESAINQGKTEL